MKTPAVEASMAYAVNLVAPTNGISLPLPTNYMAKVIAQQKINTLPSIKSGLLTSTLSSPK